MKLRKYSENLLTAESSGNMKDKKETLKWNLLSVSFKQIYLLK